MCTVRERSSKSVQRVLGSGNLPALRRASSEERRRQQHQRLRAPAPPSPTSTPPRPPAGVGPRVPRRLLSAPFWPCTQTRPLPSSIRVLLPYYVGLWVSDKTETANTDYSSCHTHKPKGPENIDKIMQNQLKRINKYKSRN